jgi:hypothetical protein
MRRNLTTSLLAAVTLAPPLWAQATGMPTFNAPYRAFTRSEVGLVLSFPGQGGGTAFEGMLRKSSGRFDIGFKGGLLDPDGGDAILLVGVEARQRVLTHTVDFPLDGALVLGAGARLVSGSSTLFLPVGLSLGRRVDPQGSQISIIPYVQPTGILVADGGTDFIFTLGLGADFRLTPRFDARISAGLGDLEGVSLSAVWVH